MFVTVDRRRSLVRRRILVNLRAGRDGFIDYDVIVLVAEDVVYYRIRLKRWKASTSYSIAIFSDTE